MNFILSPVGFTFSFLNNFIQVFYAFCLPNRALTILILFYFQMRKVFTSALIVFASR